MFWDTVLEIIDALDKITIVFASIIMVVTILNWSGNARHRRLDNQPIRIWLQNYQDSSTRRQLSQTIVREHLNRAELKGCLNDCYRRKEHYKIPYLRQVAFSSQLRNAQQAKSNEIIIELSDPESLVEDFETI